VLARAAATSKPSRTLARACANSTTMSAHPETTRLQSMLPLIGNTAYVALASGFLMTDVLALRVLLSGGYVGLVTYHSLQAKPLRIPLLWSCVFVAVNAAAAFGLAADRWPGSLSEDDERLYTTNFSQLTRGQFKMLMERGEQTSFPRGTELTREGEPSEYLYFLVSGRARLYHHNILAANIEAGGFVNDVAFQLGPEAGAYGTVVVSSAEPCRAVVWRQSELVELLRSRAEMKRNLNHVLVATLVKGLLVQREIAQSKAKGWARHEEDANQAAAVPVRARRVLTMTESEMHLSEQDLPTPPPPLSSGGVK